jgi:hypothetical protein
MAARRWAVVAGLALVGRADRDDEGVGRLHRIVPRRRRSQIAVGLLAALLLAWAGVTVAMRGPEQVPDPPVRSAAQTEADARAAQDEGEPGTAASSSEAGAVEGAAVPKPARVPDVPLAWRRIAERAESWPAASDPPVLGRAQELPTVPASQLRDTLGLNIDTWRTEDGYADFGPILGKVEELHLRHARVNMLATGGSWGLARLQGLGEAGVRLNLIMGDAFGRYGTAPYATLDRRLDRAVMPYVDSLEGTNEPDLAKGEDGWASAARRHQEEVVRSAAGRRGKPVAVVAPSLGRIANAPALGSFAALADAANAHAYSSAEEPSAPMDEWLRALKVQVPGGAPTVITEAGFQDDLRQTKWHSPLDPEIAADYMPRTILEAMRRGIPRVYLYEMVNRWSDPFHIDTAAHFGLLDHELRPKPAWNALVRLQRSLLDGGRPDRDVSALRATIDEGPDDLRTLALRRRDGSAAIAIWRSVSQWDSQAQVRKTVEPEPVRITVDGSAEGALMTDVVSGDRRRLTGPGGVIEASLAGAPIIVDGIR